MMTVSTSGARHVLFRLPSRARLPDSLLAALRDEVVLAGWMRASGVLSEVQLKVLDPRPGASGPTRRIAGPVQVIALEGSIGLVAGDVSCGLRVILARETESGLETISGDLIEARVDSLEVLVMAFDEVTATRRLDPSGVWVLDATDGEARIAPPPPSRNEPPRPMTNAPTSSGQPPPSAATAAANATAALHAGFSEVVRASEEAQRPVVPAVPPPPPRPAPLFGSAAAMPARIARPVMPEEEDQAIPEPGDIVEHFAFGRCEVVKTDGDRLHVRLPKDLRIKEIALEMLKVSPLPPVEGQTTRHYMLARKL